CGRQPVCKPALQRDGDHDDVHADAGVNAVIGRDWRRVLRRDRHRTGLRPGAVAAFQCGRLAFVAARMDGKVNLAAKLASFDGVFEPKIIAYLNDYKVYVGKVQGEFVWHKHDETDELFLVLRGRLTLQF